MPLRGSVQLLLLSLRRRAARRAVVVGLSVALVLVGIAQIDELLPSLGEDGFAQALRQSAWNEALADRSAPAHWPWEDLSASMSFTPAASVPRLGLSAAMQSEALAVAEPAAPEVRRRAYVRTVEAVGSPQGDSVQGDIVLSDVAIGGSITFTAADGVTCSYRVTGKRVIDPHLAASEAQRFDGEAALFECGPLESLLLQATQGEAKAAPEPISEQRKL